MHSDTSARPAAAGRRNYLLGVLSGTVGTLAHDFLHPELILAGMVYALTGSKLLVALVSIIHKVGMFAPQLWVGSRLEHHARKRPYFILATVIRSVATLALIASLAALARSGNGLSLVWFFLAYVAMCMCAGGGYVIFMDMAGRTIPAGRVGAFFGLRHFLGAAVSVAAGVAVIQPILDRDVAPAANYLILAVVGGALGVANMILWALAREDDGPRAEGRGSFRESFRRGLKWLRRDRNYRAFFWLRVSFRINYLGLAFFIPYGSEKLRVEGPGGVAVLGGIMVAAMKLSRVVTSIVWGRLADRRGYRSPMLGASAFFLAAPIVALIAPQLPRGFCLPIPYTTAGLTLPLLVYLLALVSLGAAFQGMIIGSSRFQIRSAPPHRRLSYVGFMNTITMPLALLPLAGAWLAHVAGFSALFAAITAGGVLSIAAALYMRPEANTDDDPGNARPTDVLNSG